MNPFLTRNSKFNRRACLEPITIHPDGHIDEVEMTTQGAGDPVPSTDGVEAWRACFLYGRLHTEVEGDREFLCSRGREDLATFRNLQFSGRETACRIRLRGKGHLLVNIGSPFAESTVDVKFDTAGKWTSIESALRNSPSGKQSLNLFFVSGETDIESIGFK